MQCLAIRHYFNETEFMVLPDQITSLIDCNKDRLNICLDLFVEIIDVVESSQSHEQLCLF